MPSKYIMGKQGLIGSRRGSEASHIQELLTSSDVHAREYHWICGVILEDEPANLICVRLRIDHPVQDEMEQVKTTYLWLCFISAHMIRLEACSPSRY